MSACRICKEGIGFAGYITALNTSYFVAGVVKEPYPGHRKLPIFNSNTTGFLKKSLLVADVYDGLVDLADKCIKTVRVDEFFFMLLMRCNVAEIGNDTLYVFIAQ